MTENSLINGNNSIRKTIETVIRLALLFILLYWCYTIIKPFIDILLWSVIFAVALYPMYNWIKGRLKGKKSLSAVIIVVYYACCACCYRQFFSPNHFMKESLY